MGIHILLPDRLAYPEHSNLIESTFGRGRFSVVYIFTREQMCYIASPFYLWIALQILANVHHVGHLVRVLVLGDLEYILDLRPNN